MGRTNLLAIVVAVILGFMAGLAGGAFRREGTGPDPGVVRAKRSELVSDSGATIAFWGSDAGRNIVLAFLREHAEAKTGPAELNSQGPVAFTGQGKDEMAAIGLLSGGSPFLDLVGQDGKPRAMLYLNGVQKPIMVMGDEGHEARALFGFIQSDSPSPRDDDWGLIFRNPDVASIGVLRDPVSGRLSGVVLVRDGKGKAWRAP